MSLVKINGKQTVEGKFSFSSELDDLSKPAKITISGVFQSAEYIEEITQLENERFILNNIKVKHEAFGSESDDIIYTFTAGGFRVKKLDRRKQS